MERTDKEPSHRQALSLFISTLVILSMFTGLLVGWTETADAASSWHSPLDHYGDTDWGSEYKAYDDDTATYAIYYPPFADYWASTYGDRLTLLVGYSTSPDAYNCTKVRFYMERDTTKIDQIDIEVYDIWASGGSWIDVYNGSITTGSYVEYSLDQERTISQMRIDVHTNADYNPFSDGNFYVKECDLYGYEPPPKKPSNPQPSDGATNVDIDETDNSVDLHVDVDDWDDSDSQDVTFYDNSDDSVIGTDSINYGGTVSATWDGLSADTTYSWYATSTDEDGESTTSDVFTFTTESLWSNIEIWDGDIYNSTGGDYFYDDFTSDTTDEYTYYDGSTDDYYIRDGYGDTGTLVNWTITLEDIDSRNWGGHVHLGMCAQNTSNPGNYSAFHLSYNSDHAATESQPSVAIRSSKDGTVTSLTRETVSGFSEGNTYEMDLYVDPNEGYVRGRIFQSDGTEIYNKSVTSNIPTSLSCQYIKYHNFDNDAESDFSWDSGGEYLNILCNGSNYGADSWIDLNMHYYEGGEPAEDAWYLVDAFSSGNLYNVSNWQDISTWSGAVDNTSSWHTESEWTSGSIYNTAAWQTVNEWNGDVWSGAGWSTITQWTGSTTNTSSWNIASEWNGAVEAEPSNWHDIATWAGSLMNVSMWLVVANWNGNIYNSSKFKTVAEWTGAVLNAPSWYTKSEWQGQVYNVTEWTTMEEWNGSLDEAIGGDVFWDFSVENNNPYGAASNDSRLWFTDRSGANIGEKRIQVHDYDGNHIETINPATDTGYLWGAAWNGTALWVSDTSADKVFAIDPSDGSVLTSWNAPADGYGGYTTIYGLGWDGTYLWAAGYDDNYGHDILKFNTDGAVVSRWGQPVDGMRGVSYHDGYLWMSNNADDKIYMINPSDMSIVNSFPASTSDPVGLAPPHSDYSYYLWVSDYATGDGSKVSTSGWITWEWSGDISSPASWQTATEWQGDLTNMSLWSTIAEWNGTAYDSGGWTTESQWTGDIANVSVWHDIDEWASGALTNTSLWHTNTEWTGSLTNTSIWQTPSEWTGDIYNATIWHTTSTLYGETFNGSTWHYIETIGGDVYHEPTVVDSASFGSYADLDDWRTIETWQGDVYNLGGWTVVETWNGDLTNTSAWSTVTEWNGDLTNTSAWNTVEVFTGDVYNSTYWHTIDTLSGDVYNASTWHTKGIWIGDIRNTSEWHIHGEWNGNLWDTSAWQTVTEWNGTLWDTSAWQTPSEWTGDVYNEALWQTPSEWTGQIWNLTGWSNIEIWDGNIYNVSYWHTLNNWDGDIYNISRWQTITEWNGNIYDITFEWNTTDEWQGNLTNTSLWQTPSEWNGDLTNTSAWRTVSDWQGQISAPAEWHTVERFYGAAYTGERAVSYEEEWSGDTYHYTDYPWREIDWQGILMAVFLFILFSVLITTIAYLITKSERFMEKFGGIEWPWNKWGGGKGLEWPWKRYHGDRETIWSSWKGWEWPWNKPGWGFEWPWNKYGDSDRETIWSSWKGWEWPWNRSDWHWEWPWNKWRK